MENYLTNDDIDFIMQFIPSTTDMGENTALWNKLKKMKNKTVHTASDIVEIAAKYREEYNKALAEISRLEIALSDAIDDIEDLARG